MSQVVVLQELDELVDELELSIGEFKGESDLYLKSEDDLSGFQGDCDGCSG